MTDSYLTISTIAGNGAMNERMRAAATQQSHQGTVPKITDPVQWVGENRYVWASSPTWAEKWDYAMATHPPEPPPEPPGGQPIAFDPGSDPAVITDDDILATVQALGA